MNPLLTPAWTAIRERDCVGPSGVRWGYVYDDVRFKIVAAGRRSTKTLHAKRQIVKALPSHLYLSPQPWFNETQRYLYGAPTDGQSRRIAWRDILDLIPPDWIKPNGIHKGEGVIETIFNAELHVRGLDQARRVEGTPWNGLILDEFPDMKANVWEENIFPLLSDRKAWVWILGVPDFRKPNNAEFKRLFDLGASGDDANYKSYTWLSADVLDESEIDIARGILSTRIFQQEYEASWVTAPGRAYEEFNRAKHIEECEFNPNEACLVSLDFNRGHHNWGMYQYGGLHNGENGYRAFDEVYLQGGTVEAMCVALQEKLDEYGVRELWFYGDYSGEALKAEATDAAWTQVRNHFKSRLPKPMYRHQHQGPIADRVNSVNAVLCNANQIVRTEIHPRCFNLIRDLEEVTMDLLYSNRKTAHLSHASDNFGYLVVQHGAAGRSKELAAKIRKAF